MALGRHGQSTSQGHRRLATGRTYGDGTSDRVNLISGQLVLVRDDAEGLACAPHAHHGVDGHFGSFKDGSSPTESWVDDDGVSNDRRTSVAAALILWVLRRRS